MSTRAEVSAAPASFVASDGVTYLMTPLRDLDLGELDRWVQKRIIETAELSDNPQTIKYGIEIATLATWAGKYGVAMSSTPEGVARYMWIGLRRNHPALSLQTVLGWTKDDEARAQLYKTFELANGVSGDAGAARPTMPIPTPLTTESGTPT
jgi:hypothetical protein